MPDSGTLSIRLALEGGDQVRQQLQQIGEEGDKSLKRVGDGADQASAKLERAFSRLAQQLDPGIKAQAQLEKGTGTLNAALASGLTTQSEHARLMDLLKSRWTEGAAAVEISRREVISFARALATGNLGEGATALARMGASASGLAGGMLGLAAAAVAIPGIFAAAAIRAEEANADALKFETTIRGLGGAFGAAGAQVQKFAADLAKGSPFSEAETSKAAAALLTFEGVSVSAFEEILPLAKDLAAVTGSALPAAAEQLARAYTGDFEAIRKLDQELHLQLSPHQLEQIRTLEEQNRTTDAARIAFAVLEARLKGLADAGMTPASKATKTLGDAWRDFLDALGGAGSTKVLTTTLGWLTQMAKGAADLAEQVKGAGAALGILMDEAAKTPAQRAGSVVGRDIPLPPVPPPIPPRNAPAGLAGGPPGSGAGTPGDIAAYNKAVADLDKKLEEEVAALGRVEAAAGKEGAAALRARLEAEAGNLATAESVRKHIDAAVAIQTHIDAIKKAAEEQKKFDDALKGAKGLVAGQQQENLDLAGLAAASAVSSAAEQAQRRLQEGSTAFADKFAAAKTSEQVAALDREYAAYLRLLEARDRYDQQTRSNDEDRRLAQTLAERQLELSLMGADATLRAQKLADLRLENELVEEGYEVGTAAFDQELRKRKEIADQIAATTVAIKQQTEAQKQSGEALRQFADELGSAFERFASASGSTRDRMKGLEQDLAKLLAQQLVFKPFETELQNLFSPASQQKPMGGLFGALLGWLGLGGAGAQGSGLDASATALDGSAEALTQAASALAEAASALGGGSATGAAGAGAGGGGLFGGIGSFFSSLFGGGGGGGVVGGTAAAMDPASFFGFAGLGFAKGGAWDLGGIRKFAAGDVFGSPALFNIGMMGESGPESIMPLARTPGGALGVRALGGGGGHTFYIDARGAQDPRATEAAIERVMARNVPGIVRLASSTAVGATFGAINQGGRAAQISGRGRR